MTMRVMSSRAPQTAEMLMTIVRDTVVVDLAVVAFWKAAVPAPSGGKHSVSPISFSSTEHSITSLSYIWLTMTRGSFFAQYHQVGCIFSFAMQFHLVGQSESIPSGAAHS